MTQHAMQNRLSTGSRNVLDSAGKFRAPCVSHPLNSLMKQPILA
jgi:hypothetical protein